MREEQMEKNLLGKVILMLTLRGFLIIGIKQENRMK